MRLFQRWKRIGNYFIYSQYSSRPNSLFQADPRKYNIYLQHRVEKHLVAHSMVATSLHNPRCLTSSSSEQQHWNQVHKTTTTPSVDNHPSREEEKSLVLVPGQETKEEQGAKRQSLRDRIFSRFSGSTFMKQALYAKDRIAERVDESDNPIVLFVRNIYDRLFGETEMGQVIREIRQVDPQFTLSEFVRQIERETAPRILNAYLRGDRETLRELCTEDAFRALSASIREREAAGLVMDPNILDISQVEVMTGKFLQGFPVMIVSFAAQQINCIRNLSNKVIEGSEDDIRAVHYIWAMVRDVDLSREEQPNSDASDNNNNNSCSWKLMEMVVRTSYSTI
ncbi:hypothetical protein GAYE_SCF40G5376 [Galdieria yellowstonensis]|uniref:Tim44-like domain-containing protein n=1 Tax=Galdieria yellowstonensis TaxID=3028027 RepID=A0AAV9IJ97_9RHOD|nr:hypothetical protein GAYE_SCF40G5376 [Galdieria yellowstonensis]